MKNMVCVPKAESETKCLKMTTCSYLNRGVFVHLQLHRQTPFELCEKIRMFAMDTLGIVVRE